MSLVILIKNSVIRVTNYKLFEFYWTVYTFCYTPSNIFKQIWNLLCLLIKSEADLDIRQTFWRRARLKTHSYATKVNNFFSTLHAFYCFPQKAHQGLMYKWFKPVGWRVKIIILTMNFLLKPLIFTTLTLLLTGFTHLGFLHVFIRL